MSSITKSANTNILEWFKGKVLKQVNNLLNDLAFVIGERTDIVADEESLKAQLKTVLKKAYFEANNSATKSEQVQHTYDAGSDFQVNFVNSYNILSQTHLTDLLLLLGSSHPLTGEVKISKKLAIDVSTLSDHQIAKLERDIAQLSKQKVETQKGAKVTEAFHNLRHVYLTVEDNLRVDQVLPVQVQIAKIDDKRE